MGCPSANTALDLVDGAVAEAERTKLQAHIVECGICRQLVAELARRSNDDTPGFAQVAVALCPGTQVGRYIIEDRLGSGGFGVVYRARDPKLNRCVALKLWRVRSEEVDPQDAEARLLREAQALAQLSHPNVMTVHEVGAADGQVYIAGEFIDGMTLTQWADSPRSVAQSVAVFAQAGAGLAAAHDANLVHRDFKPDNVVVAADGRTRVVDFGLARPANRHAREDETSTYVEPVVAATLDGSVVGTPAYMAPEQFEGQPADARSDQFAFCVALHEVITGQRPFAGDDYDSLREAVLTAKRREPTDRRLPAWLAPIINRGLARDPEQRFASMHDLLAALTRDRGATIRRAAIAATLAAAMAVTALSIAWPRAAHSSVCHVAEDEWHNVWDAHTRDEVRQAFATAPGRYGNEAWNRVEHRLTEYTNDWLEMRQQVCEATHVTGEQSAALLDVRVACLDRRKQEVAALVAQLASADRTLVERGPRAITQLVPLARCARVEALGQLELEPKDPRVVGAVRQVQRQLSKVVATRWAGRYAAAIEAAEGAVKAATATQHQPIIAEATFHLGYLYSYNQQAALAETWLTDAYHKATASRHWRIVARAAVELVMVVGDMAKRTTEGLAWARHADSAVKAHHDDANLRANLESNLGGVYRLKGDIETALAHYKRALALREQLWGKTDRSVAQSLNNLGLAYQVQARYDEAVATFARAHDIFAQALGPHHPYVGLTAQNVGAIYFETGAPNKARPYYEQALQVARDSSPEASKPVLDARFNLATLPGNSAAAQRELSDILAQQRTVLGDDHDDVARTQHGLGVIAQQDGRLEDSERYFEAAASSRTQHLGPSAPPTLFTVINLAIVLGKRGSHARALSLYQRTAEALRTMHPSGHPHLATALIGIGHSQLALNRAKRAVAVLTEALRMQVATQARREDIADTEFTLARAQWKLGDRTRARASARSAANGFQQAPTRGKDHARVTAWLKRHAP